MKKRIYSVLGLILVFALLVSNCYINNRIVNIEDTEIPMAENMDVFGMKSFDNWQTGDYYSATSKTTSPYGNNITRICIKDWPVVNDGQKYSAHITDKNYHILVRQIDENGNKIKGHNLADGEEFVILDNTKTLRIGLYHVSDNSSGMTYDKYKSLFNNGFEAYLKSETTDLSDMIETTESEESTETDNTIVNNEPQDVFGMDNISNWQTGDYYSATNRTTSPYNSNVTRICLKNCPSVEAGQKYIAHITDNNYHILVRQIDANGNKISGHNLADGNSFTILEKTKTLRIGLYHVSDNSSRMTYDKYKKLFGNGFKATLTLEDSTLDDVKSDIVDNSQSTVDKNNNSQTVVDNRTPEQKLRAEILEMLENGEMGTRDISSYKFNFSKVYLLYEDVIKNEGYVPYACTYGVTLGTTTENGIVKTIKMNYMDSGFVSRYEKLKKSISEAKSRIKDEMSDVEKALVLHDYVVKKTSYSQSVEGYAYASGALANEYSNCSGYTLALMLLLHEEGIECYYISGNNGTHGWVYAILDGEGYFIDATWDDTSTRVNGQPDHYFFVRNDNEFKNDSWRKHYQWKSYEVNATSTSTKYTNWFVHDVVSDMYYVDGFWYYWDRNTNTINRARIDGSEMEQLVQGGSSKLKLSGESAGTITYTLDGIEKNYTIK